MRTESSARPPRCRRCVCLRERVRPSVRPCMREDALASVFVTVCACVLLCVRLYACAGGLTCVHLGGGGAYTCLCVRTCVSLCVQVCFCAYPDVGIWMREGMRVFLETRVSAESCSST